MTVQRTDGQQVDVALPHGSFAFETNVERIALCARDETLHVGLPGAVTAVVELRAGGRSVEELRAGRPVVYLDQNQWSKLAAWRHGHGKLPADEAAACETLAELVHDRQLLLPASAGHVVETVPLYGQPRVALASTVLCLCRGWQMRNPLHIRLEELTRGLAGGHPVAADAFSPSADAFFSMSRHDSKSRGLPSPLAEISAEITAVLGLYDAVVDIEAIEDKGGIAQAMAAGWARTQAEVAEQLRAARADRPLIRNVVHTRFLLDLADDLARAGMTLRLAPDAVIDRLDADVDPVAQMPFLARMRHLLLARVTNTGQRWEASDLIDALFLSCAAGYADIVIGERSAIAYLRQTSVVPPGAELATTLAEGVELLGTR